ncbi:MAG: acyltransferase [Hyphomicrobiaceae bacterium]|nr:acyltransferase [Hyphomicrobiaceae bacterium]
MSGYLITTLLIEEWQTTGCISIRNFYLRRAFRIFPPLLVTLALAYAATAAGILPGSISVEGFLAQILYVSNYYFIAMNEAGDVPSGLGVLWSLAVEEHFYIVYPAALLLLLRGNPKVRSIVLVLAAVCALVLAWRMYLVLVAHVPHIRTYYGSDTRIDSILFGCILAFGANPAHAEGGATTDRAQRVSALLAAGGVVLLLATLLIRNEAFRETLRYSLQGLALMPIFYYAVRYATTPAALLLNTWWMRKLGVYSYAMYLCHHCIIFALGSLPAMAPLGRPGLLVISGLLSVAFAAAVDVWVDPYFRKLRKIYRAHPEAGGPRPEKLASQQAR